MNIKQFVNEYNRHIEDYKILSNGVLKITFKNTQKIMWLKRIIHENMDYVYCYGISSNNIRYFLPENSIN